MRVLLISHGFPPEGAGGTEIYTHDLARALSQQPETDVFVLTRESDPSTPEYAVRRGAVGSVRVFRINNTFRKCASLEESYTNPGLMRVAARVIAEIDPDVAHMQHLTCLSTLLPKHLDDRGTPVLMTLNDFWLICHRGQLLDLDGRRCSGPYDAGCARCIPASAVARSSTVRAAKAVRGLALPGVDTALRAAARMADAVAGPDDTREASFARLEHMREAVAPVRTFLVPSRTMADAFARFGGDPARFERTTQGIDLAPFSGIATPRAQDGLRIGFAGSLLPSKAPHVLLEAAAMLEPGSATVEIFGAGTSYHGDDSYAATLAPLLRQPFVVQHGIVRHEEMPARLASIDVLVVPSVWIENAPFVIKEAFAAGVPVVASDLGGMAELVTHGVDGLLFVPGHAASLAAALRRLQHEPALLATLRSGVRRPRSIADDAAELRALYARHVTAAPHRTVADVKGESSASSVAAIVLNYCTPDQTWLAVRSIRTSFDPPGSVIVVDNASPDRSAVALRASLPDVTLIESPTNGGFPAGCNAGIRSALEAGADFILLVNSDAVLAPDAIAKLVSAARSRRDAGIVAPLIVSREEPDWIASGGISYSRGTSRMRHRWVGRRVDDSLPLEPFETDAVSGCVMLIRRSALEAAGLLDESYFFSFEDIEFCLRAGTAGFRTFVVPSARAFHEGSLSIGRRSPSRVYFATRNHLKLAGALEASPWRRAVRAPIVLALNIAYVVSSPDAPLIPGLSAIARGAWHHLLGRYGPES